MPRHTFRFRAMACDNLIEVDGDDVACATAGRAAIDEVMRIEAKYSRYRPDSVVSAINRDASVKETAIDAETAALLDFADACHRQSGGLFDITSGILRRAWDFRSGRPPAATQISALLPLIGWDQVTRKAESVSLHQAGMELDFGGFGKEYAADRAAAVLLAHGLHHGFVNLGGDVVVTGPQANGAPWILGIRHPRDADGLLLSLPIASGAIATSGDYERYFDFEGRRYCHILDPRTGMPVRGLQSATVLAPGCLVAGSLTTIAMLKGDPEGMEWLRSSGAAFACVDSQGQLVSGLAG